MTPSDTKEFSEIIKEETELRNPKKVESKLGYTVITYYLFYFFTLPFCSLPFVGLTFFVFELIFM